MTILNTRQRVQVFRDFVTGKSKNDIARDTGALITMIDAAILDVAKTTLQRLIAAGCSGIPNVKEYGPYVPMRYVTEHRRFFAQYVLEGEVLRQEDERAHRLLMRQSVVREFEEPTVRGAILELYLAGVEDPEVIHNQLGVPVEYITGYIGSDHWKQEIGKLSGIALALDKLLAEHV